MTDVTSRIAGLSTAIGNVAIQQKYDLASRSVHLKADIGSTPTHDFKND